jgi:small redox-active disulfide protein 2
MAEKRSITVYGTGCKKCEQLHTTALEAASKMNVPIEVNYVTDIVEISAKGIMSTPALAIDGQVVSMGKVLDVNTITTLLG